MTHDFISKIEPNNIYSLVKTYYDKYNLKYKNNTNNIIEDLKKEIDIQKDQLDFMIYLLNQNKNYRKEVSSLFNQKYMRHIGVEVYKKYPNRIKLLEYALNQIEDKNNEMKEITILNQKIKIIFIINIIVLFVCFYVT
jgi:hypothetical protein